jgi:hypothetical protein
MFVPKINSTIPCPVCGAPLISGAIVICENCGSELRLEKPPAGGPVVERGSTHAGRRVMEVVVARFLQTNRVNLATDALVMQRIAEVSERVAREIATKGSAVVDLPFIAAGPSGPVNLKMELKKADLG